METDIEIAHDSTKIMNNKEQATTEFGYVGRHSQREWTIAIIPGQQ